MASASGQGLARRLVSPLFSLLIIGLCILFVRKLDWGSVRSTLAESRLDLVLAAALVNMIHLFFRAWRWQLLLAPLGQVRVWSLFRYTLGGAAASNLLPGRVGEALRLLFLRSHGIAVAESFGVLFVEKVLEAASILLLLLPLPLLMPLPSVATHTIAGLAGICTVLGFLVALSHKYPMNGNSWFARVAQGVGSLRSRHRMLRALGLSLAAWICDGLTAVLILAAVGLPANPGYALLALLFVNIAIAVPSTPAQIGAFEAGCAFALGLVGIKTEVAVAFGLIYHMVQVLPVTLAGLEPLIRARHLLRGRAEVAEASH